MLVNAAAGTVAAEGGRAGARDPEGVARVREAVRGAGLDASVLAVAPERFRDAVKEAAAASDVDAVIVAGGDGTVNTAASVLAGGDKPLGVLPLGTLNHFARDIGLPAEAEEAAIAMAGGHWRAVDVGEVNGRVFVNNCSIGLYPHAVRRREERREAVQKKWPAMGHALREVFARLPLVRLTLRTDTATLRVSTPQLMVGNNRYSTELLALGRRDVMDEGVLWVYVTRSQGVLGLMRLALRSLFGRLEQDRDFETIATTALQVDDRRRRRHLLALDGELVDLQPPLMMHIRPRALRVLVGPPPA